jgi:5'-nucleotidase
MRILVTNDDGIDSVGLHVLARALVPLGDVTIAAPDSEYSGASMAFGALHMMRPEIHRVHVDGIDKAWSVSGAPALCVMFSRMGAFGEPFDLVVAGINPGANVGRSVYHSGTIGAAITARNGGTHGIAVSQEVSFGSIEGQGWDQMIAAQRWESAAEIAAGVVAAHLAGPPSEAIALNVNVPNTAVSEMRGWRRTTPAVLPMRAMTNLELEPKIGHEGAFQVKLSWGEASRDLPLDSDAGAVAAGYVSLTWLSRITPIDPPAGHDLADAMDAMFTQ